MLIRLMLILYIMLIGYILVHILHWENIIFSSTNAKTFVNLCTVFPYIVLAVMVVAEAFVPAGRLLIHMTRIGNYFLGILILFSFFILFADAWTILTRVCPFLQKWYPKSYFHHAVLGILIIVLTTIGSFCGFVHAKHIITKSYSVSISKKAEQKHLRIALIADLHLGYSIGNPMMVQMVKKINQGHPDLIIIAGDIFDNNFDALQHPYKIQKTLSALKSKYGVYAVYGNHDVREKLVGGFSTTSHRYAFRDSHMEQFLTQSHIHVLKDQVITIANKSIYLVGRLDGEKAGDGTSHRKKLQTLLKNLNAKKPIIVINHEPDRLQEAADCGVDLLLCGHTHNGQFFPLTITEPLVWQNPHGILKLKSMYNFVTSGIGVYGPDMRLFTDSEIMFINISFS